MNNALIQFKKILSAFNENQAELGRAIKKSPAQVNQWLTGVRNIGKGSMRDIEGALGLQPGWMDSKGEYQPHKITAPNIHPYPPPAASIRPAIAHICELMEQINNDGLKELAGFAKCLTTTHPLKKTAKKRAA